MALCTIGEKGERQWLWRKLVSWRQWRKRNAAANDENKPWLNVIDSVAARKRRAGENRRGGATHTHLLFILLHTTLHTTPLSPTLHYTLSFTFHIIYLLSYLFFITAPQKIIFTRSHMK